MIILFETKADFENWLQAMQPELEKFLGTFAERMRQKLDFSPASLDILEQWLLESFADYRMLTLPEHRDLWNGLARYVGETFRKEIGGHWETNLRNRKYVWYRLPYLTGFSKNPTPECPHSLVTTAIDRRRGNFMSTILENTRRHEAKWKETSPPKQLAPAQSSSVWLVMFSAPKPSLNDVAEFLSRAGDWQVNVRASPSLHGAGQFINVISGEQSLAIGLTDATFVLRESAEISRRFAAGRPDQAFVASCDKRFEISFQIGGNANGINDACSVEYALRKFLGGKAVTFMPEVGEFA